MENTKECVTGVFFLFGEVGEFSKQDVNKDVQVVVVKQVHCVRSGEDEVENLGNHDLETCIFNSIEENQETFTKVS